MSDTFKYVTVKGGKQIKVYLQSLELSGAVRVREAFVLCSEIQDAGRFSATCHRCRKSWMTTALKETLVWKARIVNQDGSIYREAWTYETEKIKLKVSACPYCVERKINSVAYRWNKIKGTYNPNVKCDARCLNATGSDCSCACGGANHGSAAVR